MKKLYVIWYYKKGFKNSLHQYYIMGNSKLDAIKTFRKNKGITWLIKEIEIRKAF